LPGVGDADAGALLRHCGVAGIQWYSGILSRLFFGKFLHPFRGGLPEPTVRHEAELSGCNLHGAVIVIESRI
jgi:hypothetical protein